MGQVEKVALTINTLSIACGERCHRIRGLQRRRFNSGISLSHPELCVDFI